MYIKSKDVDNYLINIFRTNKFKKEFEKYFPEKLYNNISSSFDNISYFTLSRAYSIFSILKIINDIEFSKCNNDPKLMDWFESYDENKQIMDETIHKIRRSNLFDENFYLSQFDDDLNMDPLTHYLSIGYKENKNPSINFDGNFYLETNCDVKKSGANPLMHYMLYGKFENRVFRSCLKK